MRSQKNRGGMSETVLWTNSSPTSNFATQNVTLSESIDNYKYIKFQIRPSRTNGQGNEIGCIISVEDFKKTPYPPTTQYNTHLAFGARNTNVEYTRAVWYVSDTQVHIEAAWQTGTTTSSPQVLIPLEIIGMR